MKLVFHALFWLCLSVTMKFNTINPKMHFIISEIGDNIYQYKNYLYLLTQFFPEQENHSTECNQKKTITYKPIQIKNNYRMNFLKGI